MKTRVLVGLVLVSSLFALPAAAGASAPSSGTLVLAPAKALGPSRGGPGLPYGYKALHPGAYALAKAFADARAGVNAYKPRGGGGGGGGGGPTVTSYTYVSPSFNGVFQGGLTPPDTTGTIGPDRYIEIINDEYAVYSRIGSLLGSGTLSSLTGIPGGLFGYSLSDPQMMWDPRTQRFYYSAVYYDSLLSDNGLAVGWSKTATPRSSSDFCQFQISFGGELPDYPKLGDSGDFLIYGYNQFGTFGSTYDGSDVAVIDKPPSGTSCTIANSTVYTSGTLMYSNTGESATPVPARLIDDPAGAPGYVVSNPDLTVVPSADFLTVYTVSTSATPGVPAISGPVNVTLDPSNPYSMPPSAPQQGSGYTLDTLDGRFEAAVAAVDPTRGGDVAVWTAHAVAGGGGSEERWYEVDPAKDSVLQSGIVTGATAGMFVWNGAISPDRANNGTSASFGGNMAMSISTSSTTTDPAIQFVSEKAGVLSGPKVLVQSNGPNIDFSCSPTCRWGDYSGASPDPAATGTIGKVWLANQYNVAGGTTSTTAWRTWLFGVTP